jgi:alpha-tubulin suppressor-like RCC1 family protein
MASAVPVRAKLPSGVTITAIAAGEGHSLALGSNGTVYACGDDSVGQLGIGGRATGSPWGRVKLPAGVKGAAITAGREHSLAIGSDGALYAWGANDDGELGNGDTGVSHLPGQVRLPSGVSAIAAGERHSLAIGLDGTVYAWGANYYGELGNTTTPDKTAVPVPVQLPAGATATAVAAGQDDSLALASDGAVYAWGEGFSGQLGNGSAGNGSTMDGAGPTRVQFPAGASPTAIASGGLHSLALASDGTAYAWGANFDGELGTGGTVSSHVPVPVQFPAGVTPTAISAGQYHNLALGSDGALYAWGDNTWGQLGNGGEKVNGCTCSAVPTPVHLPTGVTATVISAGYDYSLALGSNGNVYAWGGASENGHPESTPVPVQVQLPTGVNVSTVVAGGSFSLALGSDGTVYAWGANDPMPARVQFPAGVTATAISAGGDGLALGSNGTVYAWGSNAYGELGNGSSAAYSSVPVPVQLPAGVTATAIAAGSSHNLALGSDGNVYAWGLNYEGALGNGKSGYEESSGVPVRVQLPAGVTVTAIAAGWEHSLAITTAPPAPTPSATPTPTPSPTVTSTPTPPPTATPTPRVEVVPVVSAVPGIASAVTASFTVTFPSDMPGQGEVYFDSGPGCLGLVEVATHDLHPGTTAHTVIVTGNDLPGTVGNNGILPGATYWFEAVTVTRTGTEIDDNLGACYRVTIPTA